MERAHVTLLLVGSESEAGFPILDLGRDIFVHNEEWIISVLCKYWHDMIHNLSKQNV